MRTAYILFFSIVVLGTLGFATLRYRDAHMAAPTAQQTATSSPTTSTTSSDSHVTIDETLRDVNFCGKIYKVKQIKIDGVDVVQRVAEIATKNLVPDTLQVGPYGSNNDQWRTRTFKHGEIASHLCENQARNVVGTDMIVSLGTFTGQGTFQSEIIYWVQTSGDRYIIIPKTQDIYISNEYDGSMTGPIGTLSR